MTVVETARDGAQTKAHNQNRIFPDKFFEEFFHSPPPFLNQT